MASGQWRTLPGNGTSLDPMILAAGPAYRLWPSRPVQVTRPILDGDAIGGGWIAVHTPGHTPGHTAFFHPATKVLIAGDALGSERKGHLRLPKRIYAEDWEAALRSVRKLADLQPEVICFGHGRELHQASVLLHALAESLPPEYVIGRDRRVVKALLIILLIAILSMALVTGAFLLARSPWVDRLLEPRAGADGIVQRVQSLSRLETTRYTIETVITADEQGFIDTPLGRLQIGSDRLLMIIHGRVTAGIDLEKLREEDVKLSRDGKRLMIQLPPVEIFSVDLDNEKTRVYSRETWLKRPNPNLESEARQGGEAKILATACDDGVMLRATEDAQRAVEKFIGLLGLSFFSIEVLPAPVPPCPVAAPQ